MTEPTQTDFFDGDTETVIVKVAESDNSGLMAELYQTEGQMNPIASASFQYDWDTINEAQQMVAKTSRESESFTLPPTYLALPANECRLDIRIETTDDDDGFFIRVDADDAPLYQTKIGFDQLHLIVLPANPDDAKKRLEQLNH